MALLEPEDDDLELGELEHDAFLPESNGTKSGPTSSQSLRNRLFYPAKICSETAGRFKLVLFLVAIFFFLLVWIIFASKKRTVVRSLLPEKNLKLSKELVDELKGTKIPNYVITYAPLVYLDVGEIYYPSDLATHVEKTHPTLNFTTIKDIPNPLNLDNLDKLNTLGDDNVYLTSTKSIIQMPKFLQGKKPGTKSLRTKHANSCAVVVVEKGNGIVDAFYMYFYTFNEGPSGLGHRVGNHLGDWEHNMIRFVAGKPTEIWYSQHEYGEAYTYSAVEKTGTRPIAYSAKGSHANYATAKAHDLHDHNPKIPSHIAFDHTSPGRLWDPVLSAYFYTFSPSTSKFNAIGKKDTPVNFLYFQGRWGDPEYGDEVEGQESFHGFHKWTAGPQGPLFKHLGREDVCLPRAEGCDVKNRL